MDKNTASQGLAGAPSYVPGSFPVRLSVCLGGGGGVRINSLSKLPPGPKLGSGDSGIKTNKQTYIYLIQKYINSYLHI
jgi:hypothetical protein